MKDGQQKIVPHLWFDKEAKEAAKFYVSAFGEDSKVTNVATIVDTPSGDVDVVTYSLLGYEFTAFSAGSMFKINPSVSFFVNFDPSKRPDALAELNDLWRSLAEDGTVFMPLDTYPFSERYGWVQDRYGVSWQLIISNPAGDARPAILPSLMFTEQMCGKAEEARHFYTSIFKDSDKGIIARYGSDQVPDKEGTVMYEDFMLCGQWFTAMDSARMHSFSFNEAISFAVNCDTQEELDFFWTELSAHPESEQCGWIKDKYGLSWQIVPTRMGELMGGTPKQRNRVTQAFLSMKKIDIASLERAYHGE